MKTYGDLRVRLNGLTTDEFGVRAASVAANGWCRDQSEKDESWPKPGPWLTFTLAHHSILPPALLFLTEKAPSLLCVSNVISPARDRLEYGEYNAILRSFCDDVLSRIGPPDSIDFELAGTEIDLVAQLAPEVFRRLRAFSASANKNTGSSHPYDRERWMDFLIQLVDSRATLDPHTLERWLVEEGRWDPDQASHLAEEYEFGRDLLERRKRAS